MIERVLESLLTSGPLAAVLGCIVVTLWRSLREERTHLEAAHREMTALLRKLADIGNGSTKDD